VIIFGDAHGPEKKTSSLNVNAISDEPPIEKQQVKAEGQNKVAAKEKPKNNNRPL
jgi:hypothetical protein